MTFFPKKPKLFTQNEEARGVFPSQEALKRLDSLNIELQDYPYSAEAVITELDAVGSPATVRSTGGRYFGFVIGSSLPVTLGANLLAGVWDQNAVLEITSPIASCLERISARWLTGLLDLPPETEAGFVTGATMANFTALAAARHAILMKSSWNVEEEGLFGAPPITVSY